MHGVVRVIASQRVFDYDAPWNVKVGEPTHGIGVVVGVNQILTPASGVADAATIYVDKQRARLIAIDHDRDLALLEAELNLSPIELYGLLEIGAEVEMVRFDDKDASPSVMQGTIAKVGMVRLAHSQRHVLTITVDGTDDGAAFVDGQLVGLAVQRLSDQPDVCELIPAMLISAFLAKRAGVPSLGITTQNLENPSLRAKTFDTGVLVIDVAHGESADGVLRVGDVIVGINNKGVSRSGEISFYDHVVRYDVVLGCCAPGDRLAIDFVRERQHHSVELELTSWRPLVPRSRYDSAPAYVLYAGLVFQPLTRDYLTTWDRWWNNAPKEFLTLYYSGRRTAAQHEIVILTNILADDANLGYEHLYNEAVRSIDGQLPRDFADFTARLNAAVDTVRIETTSGGVIVLDVGEAHRATERVRAAYGI